MKLFKGIDDKLSDFGYIKIKESVYGAYYEKDVESYGYTQEVAILHKSSGNHIMQSSQKGVNEEGFNNMVGVECEALKLFNAKYKQLKRRYSW